MQFKSGTTEYEETQKAKKAEGMTMEAFKEECGIPSVWGFNKMVATFQQMQDHHLENLEEVKDKDQEAFAKYEAQKNFIALLDKSIESWPRLGGWKLIHQQVPHCRVAKMYNAGDKRLEVSCPSIHSWELADLTKQEKLMPVHIWIYIKNMILAEGGKEMMGMAPAGDLERKIQEFLDESKDDMD